MACLARLPKGVWRPVLLRPASKCYYTCRGLVSRGNAGCWLRSFGNSRGGSHLKKGFMCTHCEYNWRGCHNPRRPSVTWDEGCKDFWSKGKPREPELERLSSEWIDGLDLSGLGKRKKRGRKK